MSKRPLLVALEEDGELTETPAAPTDNTPPADDNPSPVNENSEDDSLNAGLDDDNPSDDSDDKTAREKAQEKVEDVNDALTNLDAVVDENDITLPPETIKEVIENVSDDSEVTALENQLIDLGYLLDTISEAQGMSKRFALEAERIVPGFNKVPLGFYSEEPTATRYHAALEELDKTAIGIMAAIGAALLAIIYKIYKWITGSDKDADSNDAKKTLKEEVKKAEEASSESQNAIEKSQEFNNLLSHMNLTMKNDEGHEYHVKSLNDIAEHFIISPELKKFVEQVRSVNNYAFRDALVEGEYSKFITTVCSRIHQIADSVATRADLLDSFFIRETNTASVLNDKLLQHDMKLILESNTIEMNGKKMTIQDVADELYNLDVRARNATPMHYRIDDLYVASVRVYNRNKHVKLLEAADKIMVPLGIIEKHLTSTDFMQHPPHLNDNPGSFGYNFAGDVRRAYAALRQDMKALVTIMGITRSYVQQVSTFGEEVAGMTLKLIETLFYYMRRTEDAKIEPELVKVMMEIKESRTNLRDMHFKIMSALRREGKLGK